MHGCGLGVHCDQSPRPRLVPVLDSYVPVLLLDDMSILRRITRLHCIISLGVFQGHLLGFITFFGCRGSFITFFCIRKDSHVQFTDVPTGRLLQPAWHKLDCHKSAIYVFILKGLFP